jgi:hypothetical protein
MKALISQYISGGIMMGFLASSYFFFRFWQKTRDSLFAVFATSFLILAVERIFLLATVNVGDPTGGQHELRGYVYWIRFTAFSLIIVAFILKNRRSS